MLVVTVQAYGVIRKGLFILVMYNVKPVAVYIVKRDAEMFNNRANCSPFQLLEVLTEIAGVDNITTFADMGNPSKNQ